MLKWLITFGVVALLAWHWFARHRKTLRQHHPRQGHKLPKNALVVGCRQCGVMLPPELAVEKHGRHYCREHAPPA